MNFTTKTASMPKDFKVKFYFDDSSKESGVELKFITLEERREAKKELVTDVVEFAVRPDNRKLEKVVTPDFKVKELEDWVLDKHIFSFWGISIDNEPVECNKENKIKLYREYKDFRRFVDEKLEVLQEMSEKEFGGSSLEKNLLST